jgi:hypothetical protein
MLYVNRRDVLIALGALAAGAAIGESAPYLNGITVSTTSGKNSEREHMPVITTKDNTQIFYKDWGPKNAQPIMFHHGWPLSSDDWDAQMLFFLAKGYRVVAHDRRGHGRSSQVDTGHDMDQSRVGAFNRFLRAHGSTEAERELLAAKLVGRWRSGAPLTLAPEVDNPALGADPHRNNDFIYSNDPRGRQAPFGCHIRRMNPRDTELTRLTDVNLHRLIRRGTTYGPPYDANAVSDADDELPRGAYFLFISAKAMATIEFLQREWINDGNFIGVGDERDPIIGLQGDDATFTIPKEPVRRRVHGIETFNVLRGGEYFFMPSLSALKWLSELQ